MAQVLRLVRPYSLISYSKNSSINQSSPCSILRNSFSPPSVEHNHQYSSKIDNKGTKTTKILYDGECSICRVEISILRRFAKKENLEYVDITSPNYDPNLYNGITYEQAMKEMHVINDNTVYLKADAIRKMYDSVGLNWISNISRLPIISPFCDKLYVKFAEYRLQRALKNCDSSKCSIKLKALRDSIERTN